MLDGNAVIVILLYSFMYKTKRDERNEPWENEKLRRFFPAHVDRKLKMN